MTEAFDPYHKWLGIPPREQPPNHYRLLGLAPFDSDPDVIENAADRQMAHVRSFQLSAHAVASQKLLNEISAARLCLLNEQRRTLYDQELRSALSPPQPNVAMAGPPPVLPLSPAEFASREQPAEPLAEQAHERSALLASLVAWTRTPPWKLPALITAAAFLFVVLSGIVLTPSQRAQVAVQSPVAVPEPQPMIEAPPQEPVVPADAPVKPEPAKPAVVLPFARPLPQPEVPKPVVITPQPGTEPKPAEPAPAAPIEPRPATVVTNPQPAPPSEPPAAMQQNPVANAPTAPANNNQQAIEKPRTPPLAIAPFDIREAKAIQAAWAKYLKIPVQKPNSLLMKMAVIPPGEFMMGSTEVQVAGAMSFANATEQQGSRSLANVGAGETPQHKVVIRRPFLMSTTEVTVYVYKKFSATGYVTGREKLNPGTSHFTSYYHPGFPAPDNAPAKFISWNDAAAFCVWLSEKEKLQVPYVFDGNYWKPLKGNGYRLPTEEEWEYACRAGTTTQFSFGDDANLFNQYAAFRRPAPGVDLLVGQYRPNAFGLFDMHGNVGEICQDGYRADSYEQKVAQPAVEPSWDSSHVIRGGDWSKNLAHCRSASRGRVNSGYGDVGTGFRIVRDLDVPADPAGAKN